MVNLYITSAFSQDNQGGNLAGIVLNRPDLTAGQKKAIARELGYSETAFLLESQIADYQLQYFTPTDEVPLCGHATIAAFSTLHLLDMLQKDRLTIETKAGILQIRISPDGLVFMEQNRPTYGAFLAPELFTDVLQSEYIDRRLPIQIVSTGLRDILLPIDTQEHLDALTPNFAAMTKLSRELDVVGIHAFTLGDDGEYTAHCRNFAPLYGIDEESATGTASCALACYLFRHQEKRVQYVFQQGLRMGAASRIIVQLPHHEDVIEQVFVGGYGTLIGEKTLAI